MITYLHPDAMTISADISPVKAPSLSQWIFWQPISTRDPFNASTVAATLVSRAIGDRLIGVFVNTGLLRKNEFEKVLSMLQDNLHLNVHGVDASERFLNMLSGVSDPEKKRKLIGNEFIRVFEESPLYPPLTLRNVSSMSRSIAKTNITINDVV